MLVSDAGLTGFIANSVADATDGDLRMGDRHRSRRRARRAPVPDVGAAPCDPGGHRARMGTSASPGAEPDASGSPLPRLARRVHRRGRGRQRLSGATLDFPFDLVATSSARTASDCRFSGSCSRGSCSPIERSAGSTRSGRARRRARRSGRSASSTRSSSSRGSREREETYGVLGVAAGLLFGFFLIGRTMELAAALNATLDEERRRRVAR